MLNKYHSPVLLVAFSHPNKTCAPVPSARTWRSPDPFRPPLHNAGHDPGEDCVCVHTRPNISVIGQAAPPALARGTVGRKRRERERWSVISSPPGWHPGTSRAGKKGRKLNWPPLWRVLRITNVEDERSSARKIACMGGAGDGP